MLTIRDLHVELEEGAKPILKGLDLSVESSPPWGSLCPLLARRRVYNIVEEVAVASAKAAKSLRFL